ncbi:MAG: FAD-dependent oxidoreductase, partial [Deinococcales bacterium]
MKKRTAVACIILALWAIITFAIHRFQHGSLATGTLGSPSYLLSPASKQDYDVIVLGSEPEAISAAVAAAEEGASVLLLSQDARLGGLFVLGQMNSLDLRSEPQMQKGLFERWWQEVGRAKAFDIHEAELAFTKLLSEAGVDVRLEVRFSPVMLQGRLRAIRVDENIPEGPSSYQDYHAKQFIDGTAEADIAALAGAESSIGFESMGLKARMVDTLVFRLEGIDWQKLSQGIKARGKDYASVDERVAWGHFSEGGQSLIQRYQAQEEGIRLRGLNLGLQQDGSVLVNALLIHGIEPFAEVSLKEGRARATREAQHIVEFLKTQNLPGFESVSYGGVAEKLYIRETRHLKALCQLTVDDVLNNVTSLQDVAAGGYPLDVQALTPHDTGFVYGVPDIYGVKLCVNIPQNDKLDNLWVIGKAAGYDP